MEGITVDLTILFEVDGNNRVIESTLSITVGITHLTCGNCVSLFVALLL